MNRTVRRKEVALTDVQSLKNIFFKESREGKLVNKFTCKEQTKRAKECVTLVPDVHLPNQWKLYKYKHREQ